MKIRVTYETDAELKEVLHCLEPYIRAGAKVRKSDRLPPYKYLYLTIKKADKCRDNA